MQSTKNLTFIEFADSLRKTILNENSSCLRCDVIADLYFKNTLKQIIKQVTRFQETL